MWEVVVLLAKIIWAILCFCFDLWKQLTGIQNNIWAAILGVSPFIAGLLVKPIVLVHRAIKH